MRSVLKSDRRGFDSRCRLDLRYAMKNEPIIMSDLKGLESLMSGPKQYVIKALLLGLILTNIIGYSLSEQSANPELAERTRPKRIGPGLVH